MCGIVRFEAAGVGYILCLTKAIDGQQLFSVSGLCRLASCGQSGAEAKDVHAARPCSNISSAGCFSSGPSARDGRGARLHGATACSRDLRRNGQCRAMANLCKTRQEMLDFPCFRKQLLCNQGTTFRRGESLKWAADKRQRLLLEVAHLSWDRPMRTQI